LEKIEAENIESGSGDFEILESRDYNYEPNDGHNNDNNNDFDNNDEPYGDNNNGNMDPILILLLFSLNFAAVFLLIRCAIYECHPASYFGTWKKKFPFKADLIQYPTRYELKGTQPTLVRKPLTTSISFEICSMMFDKLTLRGCDPQWLKSWSYADMVFRVFNVGLKTGSTKFRVFRLIFEPKTSCSPKSTRLTLFFPSKQSKIAR